jgi:hypothetical protein
MIARKDVRMPRRASDRSVVADVFRSKCGNEGEAGVCLLDWMDEWMT